MTTTTCLICVDASFRSFDKFWQKTVTKEWTATLERVARAFIGGMLNGHADATPKLAVECDVLRKDLAELARDLCAAHAAFGPALLEAWDRRGGVGAASVGRIQPS